MGSEEVELVQGQAVYHRLQVQHLAFQREVDRLPIRQARTPTIVSSEVSLPGQGLVPLEGTSVAPYLGDSEAVLRTVEEFLGASAVPPTSIGGLSTMAQPLIEPLSNRELQVLRLIATGGSNQEIAQELVIAVGTVKTHLNKIYGKLEVHSRTQALAKARELNLL